MALLPGPAPLLREVGSFTGQGDSTLVFDLGGNVAEWVTGATGAVLLGGSADQPADVRGVPDEAGEAYRGFCVVLGPPPPPPRPPPPPVR